ncbi:hypothetical protein niasHS_017028 [Heterodera schachtii]|uniref:protein S-acyltransferase n=1 Tax=Heterodera schachtii TaxID=97005 RepID=A0ABD2HWR3_HETSC
MPTTKLHQSIDGIFIFHFFVFSLRSPFAPIILFSYKERNNEFSYANLRRQNRVAGGGGGRQFLFSRRLYDVNKGEESSLCDLLLDSERDSGAGTSLCGSSTGGSSHRRRASAPFGIHHPPPHWHHHQIGTAKQQQQQQNIGGTTNYRPHSHQIGIAATSGGIGPIRRNPRSEPTKTATLPFGQSKRRAVLLEVRKGADMATPSAAENGTAHCQSPHKEKVIIGSRTTPDGTAEGEKATQRAVYDQHFLLSQTQPSTSGTVIPLAPSADTELPPNLHLKQQQPHFAASVWHPSHGQEAGPGSPSVFIALAKEGRRRWWHCWRSGCEERRRQRRHEGNGIGTAAADHRTAPSVFVLDDDDKITGKVRREEGHTRKWRAHSGRNRFFCDGRFMLARQSSVFLLTLFLILFTMALFCVYDLPFLTEHVSLLIPAASLLLFLFVMATLFKTAFSDPGIVPRASPREVLEWERQCQETDPYFNADEWAQPRTRVVNIRGQPVKLKYCFTCCIFRPPRSSHCSICDNCVLNFDHHCPWVGNCIGLRNYRHFFLFIFSLSVLDAFLGVSVGVHLYLLSLEKGSFVEAVKLSPASILTGLINIISIWSVLGLSGFHTYLIALGQTTNEDIKGTFNRKLHPQVKNPYSSGNCVKNLIATLCAPERPSLLDRRGWFPPETVGPTIYVDGAVLDGLAMTAKRRLAPTYGTANAIATANDGNKSLLAVANGRTKGNDEGRRRGGGGQTAGGGESPSVVSIAVSSASCPPSPPRQPRRNIATGANADDQQQKHCHRVIIPRARSNNNDNNSSSNGGIGIAQRPKTTVPTATMAHRICHGNNLVAPVGHSKNGSSDWSLTSSVSITRGGKGRRSMTTNGKPSRDEANGNSRRSPMSLVDEPSQSNGGTLRTEWRRRSGSTGEIANLGRFSREQQGGEEGLQEEEEQPNI